MNKFTGIILAGGKSLRMGQDKALLPVGKQLLIEEVLTRLKIHSEKVIVIANQIKEFSFLGVPVFPDIVPGQGPLGGIYTGLVKSETFHNLIVACDMPFISAELLRYLANRIDAYDITIARYKNRFQPLCAFYSKNCIQAIKQQLQQGNLKIRDVFKQLRVNVITEDEIDQLKLNEQAFTNINTPEDINLLKQ